MRWITYFVLSYSWDVKIDLQTTHQSPLAPNSLSIISLPFSTSMSSHVNTPPLISASFILITDSLSHASSPLSHPTPFTSLIFHTYQTLISQTYPTKFLHHSFLTHYFSILPRACSLCAWLPSILPKLSHKIHSPANPNPKPNTLHALPVFTTFIPHSTHFPIFHTHQTQISNKISPHIYLTWYLNHSLHHSLPINSFSFSPIGMQHHG